MLKHFEMQLMKRNPLRATRQTAKKTSKFFNQKWEIPRLCPILES